MSERGSFSDLRIDGLLGTPEVVALDANTFFANDWSGMIRKIDWDAGTITESPSAAGLEGMVGSTLRSLCSAPNKALIAVATTAPWAAIWDLRADSMEKVHSDSGRTVFSITFSPDGKYLVLGTGFYPLDAAQVVEAAVEVWSHGGEWKLELVAALPGACVDWLAWHKSANALVALTGRRTQDGCFTSFLDGSTLKPLRISEPDVFPGYVCGLQEWPPAVAVFGENLTMIHLENSDTNDWSCSPQMSLAGACLDGEYILTTSGHFLECASGQVVGEFPPLKGCCRVTVRPGGGYVGISKDGVLRVWEEQA